MSKYICPTLLTILLPLQTFALSESDQEFRKELIEKHQQSEIQRKLINTLLDDLFGWNPPTIPPSEVKNIVAYAFGNRILPNGNRLPGPMNDKLADIAVDLHKQSGAHVYAQWEIAEAIGDRIPSEHLTSINPTLDEKANVVYLSTIGVAQAILKTQNNDPKLLGKVAVIGFHDHAKRCYETSINVGMEAYMPQGYQMATEYDKQSGQPWTRNRLNYLEHEIRVRLKAIAEDI